MSRKDYLAFAAIIRHSLEDSRKHNSHGQFAMVTKIVQDQLLTIARMLCEEFEDDNPRFDEEKFMRACGFFYVAVNIMGIDAGGSWGADYELARAEASQAS